MSLSLENPKVSAPFLQVSWRIWWLLFLFAAIGLALWAMPAAPYALLRIEPDSKYYLRAGAYFSSTGKLGASYLLWPPGYPIFLGVLGWIGGPALPQLGWANLALYSTALLIFGWIVVHAFQSRQTALLLTVCVAFGAPLTLIYGFVLSETLAVPFNIAWLTLWTDYLHRGGSRNAMLAIAIAMLSLITRYMAASAIATLGLTVLITWRRRSLRANTTLLAWLVLAVMPCIAWMGRTWGLSQTLTGPRDPPGAFAKSAFIDFSTTISNWFAPLLPPTPNDHYMGLASLILLALISMIVAIVGIWRSETESPALEFRENLLLTTSIYLITASATLLVASQFTLIDRVGNRLMAPLFLPMILLISVWLMAGLRANHIAPRYLARLAAVVWVAMALLAPNGLVDHLLRNA